MTDLYTELRTLVGRQGIALFFSLLLLSACADIEKPATEPFIAPTSPPPKQEFRWSNGKLPKSFDPARAASAPETDVVNALFEGLTEIDPQTLQVKPAVAEKWSASDDLRVWTFQLRKDARWSNGRRVTADDFVTSWKRFTPLGDKVAHRVLLENIVGLKQSTSDQSGAPGERDHISTTLHSQSFPDPLSRLQVPQSPAPKPDQPHDEGPRSKDKQKPAPFGVQAIDDQTLQITLELPDRDLPKLLATPMFFPIYGDGAEFDEDPLDDGVVTNGAFTVESVGTDRISLIRSDTYWNRNAVKLDRAVLISSDTAEVALNAYKTGGLDAVTNADFEPLALKLLSPYDDFRQTVHSAVNFYDFNTAVAPYNDRRVREALAIAIDRDRLSDGQLEGSTAAATSFIPFGDKRTVLGFDAQRARDLLDKAGYAGGKDFPVIRLVVNRNDTQTRIARTVARMWKQNLNIETNVIVKEQAEMDAVHTSGDFDLIRRGVVLPTLDEMAAFTAIFGSPLKPDQPLAVTSGNPRTTESPEPKAERKGGPSEPGEETTNTEPMASKQPQLLTEADAVYDLVAIPLYFPTSYSLVKPYVQGFEVTALGAPPLKSVSIDNYWQPRK